ncbi:MAG: sigma-70 family RNA polymerase sigma factor [Lawsonibacter sp.]|nr:sigma-70 family RNA polymerase sigma factor [Lawsonibacter sp.]
MTDRELTERAGRGDQQAFEQLVRDNEKRVYNLALRMTGSPEDALDLSQEAFLNAWRGLASFQGECSFSTWMYRLTSNVCLDFLRARKRRLEAAGALLSLDGEDAPDPAAPDRQRPEAVLERREQQELLRRALDALPDHHRQVLALRELSGLSYQEISAALALDLGTVKSRLTRARLALRTILCRDGNFFDPPPSNRTEKTP